MTRFPFPPLRAAAFLSPVSSSSSECANISCCRWKAARTSDLGAVFPQLCPARPRSGQGPVLPPSRPGPASSPRRASQPLSSLETSGRWGAPLPGGRGAEAGARLQAASLCSASRYFRPQQTPVLGAGPSFHACQIRTPRLSDLPGRRVQ